MSTAPKMKPAKAAGKQKTPAQTTRDEVENASTRASTLSPFDRALCAAQELLLGAPDGHIGELENETWACEVSTAEAIREAPPANKLSAFYSGFEELQRKLCDSARKYYNECFDLALSNRSELDATLSIIAAEIGSVAKNYSPAEFARGFTLGDLSTFLRVTALDGKEKPREIDSNGRVREFVRHVCSDYSDVYPHLDGEQNRVFRLPQWFGAEWNARIAISILVRPPLTPAIDESRTLNGEETEEFILGAEEALIRKLRLAIARAHRIALVNLGKNGSAHVAHLAPAPASSERREMPKYRSETKNAVLCKLSQDLDASNRQLCEWLDETGNVELPHSWAKHGNRLFAVAYADSEVRPKMESRFSEVRGDMRKAGYRIP